MSFNSGNLSAILSNPLAAHKYSVLNTLESFRNPDGMLHLVWTYPPSQFSTTVNGWNVPPAGVGGLYFNEWTQNMYACVI
jgi:hypothetical protein